MSADSNPLSIPSPENLLALLDRHGNEIQELQRDVERSSTKSPAFKQTLQWLLVSASLYVRCLFEWFDEKQWPMQFLGWASRNLFELEIWTRYVLKNTEYAERFAKDWIIDGIGICESLLSWGNAHRIGDMGIEDLLTQLRNMKDSELPQAKRFLDARQYLAELGMKERYDHLNPLFSKLVHPTSWSVHWKQELLDKGNMRLFLVTIGLNSSANMTKLMREHIHRLGLEPRES